MRGIGTVWSDSVTESVFRGVSCNGVCSLFSFVPGSLWRRYYRRPSVIAPKPRSSGWWEPSQNGWPWVKTRLLILGLWFCNQCWSTLVLYRGIPASSASGGITVLIDVWWRLWMFLAVFIAVLTVNCFLQENVAFPDWHRNKTTPQKQDHCWMTKHTPQCCTVIHALRRPLPWQTSCLERQDNPGRKS